jgi:uncharacterized membrane protein YgcG
MKLSILLLALTAAAFSSCTSAYKTGQTPDDVYYSPTRPQEEYVQVAKQDDRNYRGSDDYYEDRFLRMRMQDRYRWSALDDYYFNNTYAYNAYGYYNNWYSPWNNYYTWNNFYNPYYSGIPCHSGSIIIRNPKSYTPPSRAFVFNPNSYGTGISANSPAGNKGLNNSFNNNNNSRYNNRNSNRSSFGESVRKVFSNSNSDNSTPSRSYTPSSNSSSNSSSSPSRSSSSGGSSSGGGGSSRPPR